MLAASTYRERNLVERLVNSLKGDCRIAARYEKRAIHDLGMATIASVVFWL
jgi:transposase